MRLADVKLGVFQSWKNLIGLNNPKTTVELIREATDDPSEGEEVRVKRLDFRAALGRICPRFDGISLDSNTLGQKLNQLVGFVAGGMTIQEPPKTNVGRLWSLVEIAGDELQPPKSGDGRDGRDGGDGGDDRDLNQRPDEGVW